MTVFKSKYISKVLFAGGILLPILFQLYSRGFFSHSQPKVKALNTQAWLLPTPEFPAILNPQKVLSNQEKALCLLPFSRLLGIGEGLEVEPDLLEKWTFDFDKKTYMFELRNNIFFHDGSPVTSDDVIFSFHVWMSRDSLDNDALSSIRGAKAYSAGKTKFISGLKKINERRFEVSLDYSSESFISSLSLPRFVIYPKNFGGLSSEDFFKKPNGSGPYKIIEYKKNGARLLANSGYHFGAPKTNEINISYFSKVDAISKFKSGLLDNLLLYDINDDKPYLEINAVAQPTTRNTIIMAILAPVHPSLKNDEFRKMLAEKLQSSNDLSTCYPGSKKTKQIILQGLIGSAGEDPLKESHVEEVAPIKNIPAAIQSKRKLDLFIDDSLESDCLAGLLNRDFSEYSSFLDINKKSLNAMYSLLKKKNLPFWIEDFEFKNVDPVGVLQYFDQKSNEYLLQAPIPKLQKIFNSIHQGLSRSERAKRYTVIDNFLVSHNYIVPLLRKKSFLIHKTNLKGADFLSSSRFRAGWHGIYLE